MTATGLWNQSFCKPQAITWTDDNLILQHHMTSQGHFDLNDLQNLAPLIHP